MESRDKKTGGTPWTVGLMGLLVRAGIPVISITESFNELKIVFGPTETTPQTNVSVVPLSSPGPFFKETGLYGYRYRAQGTETAELYGKIDLLIAIFARLEDRLPGNWGQGTDGGAARGFTHKFPFASVDQSITDRGKAQAQILIRLTTRCNQNCPFCSAPECPEPSDQELWDCLEHAAGDFPGGLVTLTGGEPTLRRGWQEVLERALALEGIEGVQVQTNAVAFAQEGLAAKMPKDPRLLWFVSLHSIDEGLYDKITQTKGQLPRALEGLRGLLAAGHQVIVNAVVGSENAAHLQKLAAKLPGLLPGLPLPELHVSVLMCPPHRPDASKWLIPYEELVPLLEKAVEAAAESGLPMSPLVASTHASIPPCFVSPEQRAMMSNRPLISPGETGYRDFSRPWVKDERCKECHADDRCLGVPALYGKRFGLSGLKPFKAPVESWEDRARRLLIDRPGSQVRLAELVDPESIPNIPCTRPWTRLELHDGGTYGPCCADYMADRHFTPTKSSPEGLWASDLFKDYREQMISGGHPKGCRTTCPVLQGAQETAGGFVLTGGPAQWVENQILMARGLVQGRVEIEHNPISVGVPVTSFCNFDCLMCDCGELGTLEDQRPMDFWQGLEPWLINGTHLDVNGGEPLASPVFRQWLQKIATLDLPGKIGLVTNGSLLTPQWVNQLDKLPFGNITISLNGATADTYKLVNRGVAWGTIQGNLDNLLARRSKGLWNGEITYSMVILRANLHEIRDFAKMGLEAQVHVRYLLPQRNRNNQSIFTSRETMEQARDALYEAGQLLIDQGQVRWGQDAIVQGDILDQRLKQQTFQPIGND